jgi:hypothetical protein
MISRHFAGISLFVALSAAVAPSRAQNALDRTGNYFDDRDAPARTTMVRNANKASRVVGMRVKNLQNQDLGRISDVVFDLQTGRIAYAVLAFPGEDGEKLIAVPPGALSVASDDSSKLMLDMDRARLDRAPGFSRNNWPDVDRPFADAGSLWNLTERRYSTRDQDYYDRDHSARADLDRYRSDYYRSEVAQPDQGVPPRYQTYRETERYRPSDRERVYSDRGTFRGHVIAVSPESRTLSVESNAGEVRDFVFGDRPNIQLKNNRNPRIVDIKVGFPIIVGYREDPDGTYVAQTIIRTDTPEVK